MNLSSSQAAILSDDEGDGHEYSQLLNDSINSAAPPAAGGIHAKFRFLDEKLMAIFASRTEGRSAGRSARTTERTTERQAEGPTTSGVRQVNDNQELFLNYCYLLASSSCLPPLFINVISRRDCGLGFIATDSISPLYSLPLHVPEKELLTIPISPVGSSL